MTIGTGTKGVYAIAPTPFHPDGTLDLASLDRMVDFYEAAGVDGLTILGIMGEAPKLDAAEALEIVSRIVSAPASPSSSASPPPASPPCEPSPAPRWTSAPPQ